MGGRNQGTLIRQGRLDDTTQILPAGHRGRGFMLLQQAKAGTDDLGFVVEAPAGNKPINQFLEMGRNDFAHAGRTFQQFQPVVNPPDRLRNCF